MFFLVDNIFTSIAFGFLWAIILSALFVLLIHLFCSFRTSVLFKCIVTFVLFFFYLVQCSLFSAAGKAKMYVANIENIVSEEVVSVQSNTTFFSSAQEANNIKHEVLKEYPVLAPFIENIDVDKMVGDKELIAKSMSTMIRYEIEKYRQRRIIWMVLVTVLSVIALTFMDGGTTSRSLRSSRSYSGRGVRRELSRPTRRAGRRR